MGYWPRHQVKELEALLGEFHEAGWTITKGKKYYRVRCGCGKHQTSVHLTPSNPRYQQNMLKWLYRQDCYEGSVDR